MLLSISPIIFSRTATQIRLANKEEIVVPSERLVHVTGPYASCVQAINLILQRLASLPAEQNQYQNKTSSYSRQMAGMVQPNAYASMYQQQQQAYMYVGLTIEYWF